MRSACEGVTPKPYAGTHAVAAAGAASQGARAGDASGAGTLIDVPMYQIDALVRRAPSLQKTREGRAAAARY
jgi:hypothetical protein